MGVNRIISLVVFVFTDTASNDIYTYCTLVPYRRTADLPGCAFNQMPVNAALAFRSQLQGRTPARIQVRMNPDETGYAGMDSTGPFNSVSEDRKSTRLNSSH